MKKQDLKRRITTGIEKAKEAQRENNPFAYLPEVIVSLERMIESLKLNVQERSKMAGAMGRLILEDADFAESSLARLLLKLADDFAED